MKEVEQNVNMVMCTMMSQFDFEVDKFDDKYLYLIAAKKEFAESQIPLSVHTMKQHKDEDATIQKLIEKKRHCSIYYQGSWRSVFGSRQ